MLGDTWTPARRFGLAAKISVVVACLAGSVPASAGPIGDATTDLYAALEVDPEGSCLPRQHDGGTGEPYDQPLCGLTGDAPDACRDVDADAATRFRVTIDGDASNGTLAPPEDSRDHYALAAGSGGAVTLRVDIRASPTYTAGHPLWALWTPNGSILTPFPASHFQVAVWNGDCESLAAFGAPVSHLALEASLSAAAGASYVVEVKYQNPPPEAYGLALTGAALNAWGDAQTRNRGCTPGCPAQDSIVLYNCLEKGPGRAGPCLQDFWPSLVGGGAKPAAPCTYSAPGSAEDCAESALDTLMELMRDTQDAVSRTPAELTSDPVAYIQGGVGSVGQLPVAMFKPAVHNYSLTAFTDKP